MTANDGREKKDLYLRNCKHPNRTSVNELLN